MDQNEKPPIISIIGRSGVGKTTFLTKLVRELKDRGYRVAVLKHHRPRTAPGSGGTTNRFGRAESQTAISESSDNSEHIAFATPGKDTWHHFRAGADTVIISGHDQMAMYHRLSFELGPDDLVRLLPSPVDIVLTEGHTSAGKPAIEIRRAALTTPQIAKHAQLIAVVSDTETSGGVPHFGLEDVDNVATLLERRFSLTRGGPGTGRQRER